MRLNKSSVLIFVLILGVLIFYFFVNPLSSSFLIKCPFKTVTGMDCPGCGSQRALHSLLHGDFEEAFAYNPLFVFAIPYIFVWFLFQYFDLKSKYSKTQRLLFGKTSVYMVAAIIILFFFSRNL